MTRPRRLRALAAVATATAFALLPAVPARADAIRDQQWGLEALHTGTAWQTTKGKGITVRYRTGKTEWRVDGTSSMPTGQRVAVVLGSTLTGPVIGTTAGTGTIMRSRRAPTGAGGDRGQPRRRQGDQPRQPHQPQRRRRLPAHPQ